MNVIDKICKDLRACNGYKLTRDSRFGDAQLTNGMVSIEDFDLIYLFLFVAPYAPLVKIKINNADFNVGIIDKWRVVFAANAWKKRIPYSDLTGDVSRDRQRISSEQARKFRQSIDSVESAVKGEQKR